MTDTHDAAKVAGAMALRAEFHPLHQQAFHRLATEYIESVGGERLADGYGSEDPDHELAGVEGCLDFIRGRYSGRLSLGDAKALKTAIRRRMDQGSPVVPFPPELPEEGKNDAG